MELFEKPQGIVTRWASFENPSAGKGIGGGDNRGAKGHAFEWLRPGQTLTLVDVAGSGVVRRTWLTTRIKEAAALMLRGMVLRIYWDGASQPAVDVPLGDFFCNGVGRATAFQNALFANPEGRSFICHVPMPFRTAARMTITNETDRSVEFFYDVDLTLGERHGPGAMYFHAAWRRERRCELGRDFEVLPKVAGRGRFLGAAFSVITDPAWGQHWWGEGEVKVFLDGDGPLASLVGTGTEDYIGTAWGQGAFANLYSGCTVADAERGHWAFYRLHVPDPVYFDADCRVTIHRMGGAPVKNARELLAKGATGQLVSAVRGEEVLLALQNDPPLSIDDPAISQARWCNLFRSDDWSATVYFYLDKPESGLLALAPLSERVAALWP